MINLPKLTDFDLKGKKVIVRVDLDVPMEKKIGESGIPEYKVVDESRIRMCIPTLKLILDQNPELLVIIGHIGKAEEKISTANVWPLVSNLLGENVSFKDNLDVNFVGDYRNQNDPEFSRIILFENLRFFEGEEKNNEEFVKNLIGKNVNFYVNESFATSHRAHASIVGLPKLLPHAAGLRFVQETENLNRVLDPSADGFNRPVVAIISGVKEDKVEMIKEIKNKVDKVLVGGRLPEYLGEDYKDEKVIVAKLNPDKEDLTINSIEIFEQEIARANTIVLAGVPGKYEESGQDLGTERIFKAVANSSAFKVVGGGDSLAVVAKYNLSQNFNWISVGGGAMLEFLAKGTLPGIEALLV